MWTSEVDAELVRLKAEGFTFAEISERMGVTRNAAISRFQRLSGKKYPQKPPGRRPRTTRQINLFLTAELYQQIKARCDEREMPITSAVRALLEREFSKETTPAA
jgi:hypothetical protein